MTTKYIKIQLGEPNEDKQIFVREKDFQGMQKALKSRNLNRVVKAVINVLLGSPDGMSDLLGGIRAFSFIQGCNQVDILKNFRDLISYEIKRLKNKKLTGKSKKESK